MPTYRPTIGLEIHAELKTQSKMFCGCRNDPDETEPNTNICPVCMAHPGTLPVINRAAVEQVLRVGTALGGTLANFTEFDRKNYFYPDIPKNYQISQYQYPLVSGGSIGPVAVTRVHLEEDTARSLHGEVASLVDYNRAGVPLMELVTEPVIHDAETAVSFARDLRLLLRYLGASDANLEKGEMRVEANISLSADDTFGTKVEVKNLNSFRAVEQSIAYEIQRQAAVLDAGEGVRQETRGWDEAKQRTFSQRSKENSHDYRYFPDPDLPKLYLRDIPAWHEDVLRSTLPELPWKMRDRYVAEYQLQEKVAQALVSDIELNTFFAAAARLLPDTQHVRTAAHYLATDLVGLRGKYDDLRSVASLDAAEFAAIVRMTLDGTLSSRGGKDTLAAWLRTGGDPRTIAQTLGVLQVSDTGALGEAVREVLRQHESVVAEYRAGKSAALEYLVGQGMKATKGAANPSKMREIILEQLG